MSLKSKEKMLTLNNIYQIDVLKGLQQIEDNSVDIIIADPPYNLRKDFGNNLDNLKPEEWKLWCKLWIKQCIRIIKNNGSVFIYGFSEHLAYLFVDIPIPNKRWLIWSYLNKNVASLNFWQRSHESIICCWKGDKPLFNRDLIREPYTEAFLNNSAGKVRKGMKSRFGNGSKTTIYRAHQNGALPRDVIRVPTLAGGNGGEVWCLCKDCDKVFNSLDKKDHNGHNIVKHPTQKPLAICEILIKSCMPLKDGLVVIPFAGSGSECVAAKNLGINFVAFEINPDYIKIGNVRLKEEKYYLDRTKENLDQSLLFN